MYPVTPSGCFVMQLRSRVAFDNVRKNRSSSIPCSARSPPPKSSICSPHLRRSSSGFRPAADAAFSSEEDSDSHSHTSSVLGGGSSDDDVSNPSSSDDDNDSALYAPEHADEDDATVAQWRRNSYSASTLVLFHLFSMPSYKIIHVQCRVKQAEPSRLCKNGIQDIKIAQFSARYANLSAGEFIWSGVIDIVLGGAQIGWWMVDYAWLGWWMLG